MAFAFDDVSDEEDFVKDDTSAKNVISAVTFSNGVVDSVILPSLSQ
jgi:hypothetical protein